MDFKANYLEIEPRELVHYLLHESGQDQRDAVNPADVLSLLKLDYETFDFDSALPEEARGEGNRPRALLSFPDRLVAVHSAVRDRPARFSVLHEIGHYVLPNHQHRLYLCDDQGLGFSARLSLEREANEFAADLLFQGDRFTLEANSHPIAATTVKTLGKKYLASFEATARRLVERNLRPCMLIVFGKESSRATIDIDSPPVWSKKYAVASVPFRTALFTDVQSAVVPVEIAAELTKSGRDIAEGYACTVSVKTPSGERTPLQAEFFCNQYSIFCFLTPLGK